MPFHSSPSDALDGLRDGQNLRSAWQQRERVYSLRVNGNAVSMVRMLVSMAALDFRLNKVELTCMSGQHFRQSVQGVGFSHGG